MAKKRRGYFKHYNDASIGESLSTLAAKKEYLAICLFWRSVEILNQENSNSATIDLQKLALSYNARRASIVASYEAITRVNAMFSFLIIEDKVSFTLANYLEYQENRGQKTSKKRPRNVPIIDYRLKIKDKRLNNKKHVVFDFEKLYENYPLKKGKSTGLKKAMSQIKTEQDYQDCIKAIVTYCEDIERNGTDPKYIKHFSTFMTSWRDWLDPDNGKVTIEHKSESQKWLEAQEQDGGF